MFKQNLIPNINKQEKYSFVGIALAANSTSESAAAILDRNAKIITLDKLFTNQDLEFFINELPGKKNSLIMVSIPENEAMINSKWKYNSRNYHPVNLNSKIKNTDDWTTRFSNRSSDYFLSLKEKEIDIFRYDIMNLKKAIGFCEPFKDRTPLNCKSLQNTLKINLNMRELPSNMLPAAQLEAILGAYFAYCLATNNENYSYKTLYQFNEIDVLGF